MPEQSRSAIARWLRDGPNETDGTLGWILGHFLWWRLWAFIVLFTAPLLAGSIALTELSGAGAVWVTFGASALLHPKAMRVNPKYNVTKNY